MNAIASLVTTLVVLGQMGAACAQDAPEEKLLGVLLAAGDIAVCDEKGHKATAAILREQMDDATRNNVPLLVLALGDLAYPGGGQKELNCFHSSWGKAVIEGAAVPVPGNDHLKNPENRLLPVPGNHDERGAKRFYRHFKKNPWVHQQGDKKGYFVLDFPSITDGPWRLLGLNSELRGRALADQDSWLADQLKGNKPRCVVAFWHRPLISSGEHGHGDCEKGGACTKPGAELCRPDSVTKACMDAEHRTMKNAYNMLHQRGASFILNGHDHDFEQLGRHDPDGKPDLAKGLRSFVVGTGGITPSRSEHSRWDRPLGEVYSQDFKGILRIDLYQDRYTWKFISTHKDKTKTISLKAGEVVVDHDTCNVRP